MLSSHISFEPIYKLPMLRELYKKLPDKKGEPNSHYMEEPIEDKTEYKPDGYIITTYSGNHYKLVSYKGKTFFRNPTELPVELIRLIKRKCSKTGLYKKIKFFNL